MDENSNIKLFNADQNKIEMPSINQDLSDEQAKLISDDIQKAISGEQVKIIIVQEDIEISPLNYIFDFTDLSAINVIQKEALKALISKTGDIQLYLYKKQSGLIAFGMGNKYDLERMVPLIKHNVFNDEIKIYKNFKIGSTPEEVVSKDITKMRLNL